MCLSVYLLDLQGENVGVNEKWGVLLIRKLHSWMHNIPTCVKYVEYKKGCETTSLNFIISFVTGLLGFLYSLNFSVVYISIITIQQ